MWSAGPGEARVQQSQAVESLLLVVAELLTVPLLAGLALGAAALGVVVLAVGTAVVRPRRAVRPGLVRWWRRVVWTTTGGLGLVLIGLLCVDLLAFETGVRLALDQVEQRSGIDLAFEQARGSVFTGRLELRGVTARRSGAGSEFSLQVREVVLDVEMTRIFRAAVPLAEVRIAGVRGDIVRRAAQAGAAPLHAFVVDRLELTDVDVRFEDEIGAPFQSLPIQLEHFNVVGPLRSEYAARDVLCNADARGQARGYAFGAGGGAWRAAGIPLGPAAHKLGPAGRWIRSGEVDVVLTCLSGQDPATLPLTVELRLHDFQVAPPGAPARNLPASRIVAAIARLGPEIEVRSTLVLAESRVRGATHVGQLGLWEGAIQAWNVDLVGELGLGPDDLVVLGLGAQLLDKLPRRQGTE